MAILLLLAALTCHGSARAQALRDPWQQPFAANSIWNTSIGSGATYVPANINNNWGMSNDYERFVTINPNDPLRTLYYPGAWDNRDTGTQVSWLGQMRVPDSLIIPDAINENGVYSTPNECSTFLQPNGRDFIQLEPTTRTTTGGAIWGYPQTDGGESPAEGNLFGRGERGTHYGSGLSAIGGSLRVGELTSPDPLRHALKIELWGQYYYWYSADLPGYKWPARNADGGASTAYGGTDRNLLNGSLLAVEWNTSEASLGGLESEVGRKLFRAFKEYGAYIVDDTGWYNNAICADIKVNDELRARYGYAFDGAQSGTDSNPLSRDLGKIFRALQIVTNNTPTSVGGPGEHRVTAPLPEFAYGVRKTIAGNTQIEAEDYNTGDAGVAYNDSDNAQNGGAYRNGAVDIRASVESDAGAQGNFQVGWTTSGEWLRYDVNVTAAGTYTLEVRASSRSDGGVLRLEDAGGNLLTTATINSTGSHDVFQTFTSQPFALTAGAQTLTLKLVSGGYDLNWFRLANTGGGLENGAVYELEPECAPGKRLAVSGASTADGARAVIWTDNNGGDQRWRLEQQSNGSWEIIPQHATSKRLDVSGAATADAASVIIWADNNGSNQRWSIIEAGNGFYELEPQHAAGKRLDVSNSGNADGTLVQLYTDNNSTAQRFRLLRQQ